MIYFLLFYALPSFLTFLLIKFLAGRFPSTEKVFYEGNGRMYGYRGGNFHSVAESMVIFYIVIWPLYYLVAAAGVFWFLCDTYISPIGDKIKAYGSSKAEKNSK